MCGDEKISSSMSWFLNTYRDRLFKPIKILPNPSSIAAD
jgi:hypothetical protein